MKFELQPVLSTSTDEVFGYELLFRGARTMSWLEIDKAVVDHFSAERRNCAPLFINLSNEALLTLPPYDILRAHKLNSIVIELSEVFSDDETFKSVAERVDYLSSYGIRFALDDFGNGHDGLHRLYALNKVSYIKLDGQFLKLCLARPEASAMLECLIKQWKVSGIQVIAEWVETHDICVKVRALGVDFVQGWQVDKIVATRHQQRVAAS